MAVDTGRVIAEAIDNSYSQIGAATRIAARIARRRAYFEWVRIEMMSLREAYDPSHAPGTRFTQHTEGGGFDKPEAAGRGFGSTEGANKDYRAGYKAGWKAMKDGNPQDPNPQPRHSGVNPNLYQQGYEHGYKKSGHARELVAAHDSGDHDTADELAAKHFVGPSSAHHMPTGTSDADQALWNKWVGAEQDPERSSAGGHPMSMTHVRDMIGKIDQNLDLPDPHGMEGLDYRNKTDPETQHHVNLRPHPADIGPHLAGKIRATSAAKTRSGAQRGIQGARDIVKRAGDITNPAGRSDIGDHDPESGDERVARRGETSRQPEERPEVDVHATVGERKKKKQQPTPPPEQGGGVDPEMVRRAQKMAVRQGLDPNLVRRFASLGGGAPTPSGASSGARSSAQKVPGSGAGARSGSASSPSPVRQQIARDVHLSLKPDLAVAAFGRGAVAAHQAAAGNPNHPDYNPDINAFMSTDHGGDPHAAIEHAHDLWTNQLERHLREQQKTPEVSQAHKDIQPKEVPLTAPIPGDPYGRHAYVLKSNEPSAPGKEPKVVLDKLGARGSAQKHKTAMFDPVDIMMTALRSPGGFNPGRGWIPSAVNQHPEISLDLARTQVPAIAKNEGVYKEIEQKTPRKVHQETGEPLESDEDYANRVQKLAHDTVESDPRFKHLKRKPIQPGGGAYDRAMRAARMLMERARNEHGDWLAHEGTHDNEVEEHPMWSYNYGLGERHRNVKAGKDPRNLVAQPVQGHPHFVDYGARKGEKSKNVGRRSLKPKEEGYVRTSTLAETVNHMLDVFEQWIEDNVNIPEGNMDIVMEDILARTLTPAYNHLFEVAY